MVKIINNNVFGPMMPPPPPRMCWGMQMPFFNFSSGCCNGMFGGNNKMTNWLLGAGLASSVVGNLFNIFGNNSNKPEGAGGVQTTTAQTAQSSNNSQLSSIQKEIEQLTNNMNRIIEMLGKENAASAQNTDEKPQQAEQSTQATAQAAAETESHDETQQQAATAAADDDNTTHASDTDDSAGVHHNNKIKKNNSPQGWYRVSADNDSRLKDITKETLQENRKKGKVPARYILDTVLATKLGTTLNEENKTKLLSAIIKKNPSVFIDNGHLKSNADLSKLDIPSKEWIKQEYGVQTLKKGKTVNTIKKQKEDSSKKFIRGNNGYYVVITNGFPKYYNPKGEEIKQETFAKFCPNIAKTAKANTIKDPNN